MIVPNTTSHQNSQRGMVLMTMAITAIAMIGAMGLAIDVGHIFIVKNETQAYVDAAAIAAALQMDGTTAGITRANDAAANLSAHWNFDSKTLTSPTVEFSSASSGAPWYAPGSVTSALAPNMLYARVTKTVAPNIYFIPVVMTSPVYTQNVQSRAMAGQVDFADNTVIALGLGPFMGVAACSGNVAACEASGPDFGLTVGQEYDIQWPQYNSTRKNCGSGIGSLDNCFVSRPCAGDEALNMGTANPEQEVVKYWGSKTNGYWGASGTSVINEYILDARQLAPLAIGTDMTPDFSNGDKQGSAKILDQRVNQDIANYDPASATTSAQKLTAYLAASHNGRRIMPLPMVYPGSTSNESQVVGYAAYLLETDQTSAGGSSGYYAGTNGNQPYCGIYVGPWVMGSTNGGVGSSSGGSRVRLVQ
jgi:Flp pilus assembly protein TadG